MMAAGEAVGKPKSLKRLIRVVAFDDGSFKPRTKQFTFLVGVVYRPDNRVEGVISTKIRVDSLDATRKIISLLKGSRFLQQVRFVLLDGVNFAGFNIVDIGELSGKLSKPVLVVFRRRPNMRRIGLALARFRDREKRMRLIEKAGEIHKAKNVYFQFHGTDAGTARQVISRCTVHSNMPEPLRLAHLIASGMTRGQSTRH